MIRVNVIKFIGAVIRVIRVVIRLIGAVIRDIRFIRAAIRVIVVIRVNKAILRDTIGAVML